MHNPLLALSLLFLPLSASAEPLDSTLILFAQFNDARMTATAIVVDTDEQWVLSAHHFTRSGRDPVALLPIRDARGQLATDPEPYWQRLNQKQVFGVRPLWSSKPDDLVLLEVADLPKTVQSIPLAIRLSETNERFTLIGHPMSRGTCFEQSKATLRSIDELKWNWTGQRIDSRFLCLEGDSPFPSGYSGGPVLNARSELAGMVVAAPDPRRNAVYATDAAKIRSFLSRVYVLESWKAFVMRDTELARRRMDKASSLDPHSLPTRVSRWSMNRLEYSIHVSKSVDR